MTLWCSYGSRIGRTGMACRILKLKSPPEVNPAGLSIQFAGQIREPEDKHLEHTTSRSLRNPAAS